MTSIVIQICSFNLSKIKFKIPQVFWVNVEILAVPVLWKGHVSGCGYIVAVSAASFLSFQGIELKNDQAQSSVFCCV